MKTILSVVLVLRPPEVEAGRAKGESDALPGEPILRDGVELAVRISLRLFNLYRPGD